MRAFIASICITFCFGSIVLAQKILPSPASEGDSLKSSNSAAPFAAELQEVPARQTLKQDGHTYHILAGAFSDQTNDVKPNEKQVANFFGTKVRVINGQSGYKTPDGFGASKFYTQNLDTDKIGLVSGEIIAVLQPGMDPKTVANDYDVDLTVWLDKSRRAVFMIKPGKDLLMNFKKMQADTRLQKLSLRIVENKLKPM